MKRKPERVGPPDPPESPGEATPEPLPTRSLGSDEWPAPADGMPASIGEYRILRKLGEGGMGVVYEAEQASLHRRVALKVIRGGAGADEHRLRMFEREAETLARLKHPNIGAIHEVGRSADGQPFLVMEIVEGLSLDAYLRTRGQVLDRLEIEFRLRLFLKLCEAVSYAHQRGVIHRDLKPANIVVGDSTEGVASGLKVLDFGLARIIDENSPSATMATAVGTIKGTLYYMSPEQARGEPQAIDVRTDVYALGVILFEMLTGRRPLELAKRSLVETVRTICEEPPQRLRQAWPGPQRPDEDLETILGKALEKDVERRYAGVAALADDVERYLTSRPISARPPSNTYLLKKFAQRNRALVGGVVATVAVLVAGVAVSTVLGVREARQRRVAEAARDDLQAVVDFQSNMIGQVDPERAGARILTALRDRVARSEQGHGSAEDAVRARLTELDRAVRGVNPTDLARDVLNQNILVPAAGAAKKEFASRPLIEGRLQQSIGSTYRGLGLYEDALPHAERAVKLFRDELGSGHVSTLQAEESLARLLWDRREYDRAEASFRDILSRLTATLGPDDPSTVRIRAGLAALRWAQGQADAEPQYLEVLAIARRVFGDDNVDTASAMHNLGVIYFQQGRNAEALPMWTRALDVRRRHLAAENPDTLETMIDLASLHRATGEFERADALYNEALEIQRRALGNDDPRTLATQGSLASLYEDQGLGARAIELQRKTLEARLRVLGPSNPETLRSMNNMAMSLMRNGEYGEARRLLEELIPLDQEVQPESQDHAVHLHSLGELLMATGELPAAERTLLRALTIYERISHRYAGLALYQLGGIAARQGRRDDALSYLRRALERGHKRGWNADAPEFASLRGDAEFAALIARAHETSGGK